MDLKNFYWASGSVGWAIFIIVCLRWLWLAR